MSFGKNASCIAAVGHLWGSTGRAFAWATHVSTGRSSHTRWSRGEGLDDVGVAALDHRRRDALARVEQGEGVGEGPPGAQLVCEGHFVEVDARPSACPSERAGESGGALVPRDLLEQARSFARDARAERTRDAYRYQCARFEAWCEEYGLVPLPAAPGTVALYLTAWADDGGTVASLAQALAAISEAHSALGHPSPRKAPEVREVWKGIRRRLGTAPARRVAPVVVAELRQLVSVLDETRIGRRDRALLTLGFAAALRRSELVALDVEDLRFTPDGLETLIRKSKTDQDGAGALVGVPFGSDPATCPVRTVRAWFEDATIGEGPAIARSAVMAASGLACRIATSRGSSSVRPCVRVSTRRPTRVIRCAPGSPRARRRRASGTAQS